MACSRHKKTGLNSTVLAAISFCLLFVGPETRAASDDDRRTCLEASGEAAVPLCTKSTDTRPKDVEVILHFADVLMKLKRLPPAISLLERSLVQVPGDEFLKSKLVAARSNYEEQLWLEKRKAGRKVEAPAQVSRIDRIRCLKMKGEAALKACESALAVNGEDGEFLEGKGDVLLSLGRHQEAQEVYQTALKFSADSSVLQRKLNAVNSYLNPKQPEAAPAPVIVAAPEPKASPPAPQAPQPAPVTQPVVAAVQPAKPASDTTAADSALWDEVKFSSKVSDFQRYVAAYPDGMFIQLAANQIRSLISAQAAAATKAQPDSLDDIEFGDFHALVIGINDYKYITKLGTAVGDAKAVAEVLKDQYGFKVQMLIDPDRAEIVDAFDEYRETLSETDNLLIYYAGHGWLDDETDEGYWLTVKAKSGRKSQWVSNSTITKSLMALPAKHVMVVADSCFSGTLTRAADISFRNKNYLKRMAEKRARVAMVSGGLEPVADDGGKGHSPFAQAFIEALTANTSVIDGTRLFSQIRRPVILNAQQTPEYSDVRNAGHDGGDFLFVKTR
jgi:tetratricopeptide (TPR) repeat protein